MLKRTAAAAALLAFLCASCAGAAEPAKPAIDATKYLTADKLARGMKGYGLTVFKGTKPEKFDVEVIGVMHNVWDVGSDIILIRCSGHDLETSGIAAGMSGSPIYIDGKLIGALAYGFPFAKAAIAGVTPIAEMLPLAAPPPPKDEKKPARADSATLKEPVTVFGREFKEVKFVQTASGVRPDESGVMEMCPIATPVRLSGLGPQAVARRLLDAFGPELERVGLMPVQGGGASDDDVKDAKLEPGSVMGARLLWGDLNWDAIGTVTETAGNRVIGFGHPMYGQADVSIPLTTGYVFTILPSFSRSIKLGAGGAIVGCLDTDRSKGVAGTIGAQAKSVETAVTVTGLPAGKTRKYGFHALRHPAATPVVIGTAVASCLFQTGEPPDELTCRYKITVVPEGHGPLVIENIESGLQGVGAAARVYLDVRSALSDLTQNGIERIFPASVKVEASFEPGRRFASIETVALDNSDVRRGESLRMTVELKHLKGERVRKLVSIAIPRDAPLGPAALQVCDAGASEAADRKDAPDRFAPKTVAQLLKQIAMQYRRDQLYVRLSYAGSGVGLEGKELPDLPRSIYGIMASGRDSALANVRNTVVTVVPCETVLTGSQLFNINVREEK